MNCYHFIFFGFVIYDIRNVAGKIKRRNCDYLRNEYYSEALRSCKKCDPCPIGEGLQDTPNFEFDPVKGALGCRICRACDSDTFQKRHRAFRRCKPCRHCKQNEIEIQKCSNKRNRKCEKVDLASISTQSSKQQIVNLVSTTELTFRNPIAAPVMAYPDSKVEATTHLIIIDKDNEAIQQLKNIFGATAGFICLIAVVLATIFLRRRVLKWRQKSEDNQMTERTEPNSIEEQSSSSDAGPDTNSTHLDVEETILKQNIGTNEGHLNRVRCEEKKQTAKMSSHTEKQIDTINKYLKDKEESSYTCHNKRQHANEDDPDSTLPLLSTFNCSLKDMPEVSSLKYTHEKNRRTSIEKNKTENRNISTKMELQERKSLGRSDQLYEDDKETPISCDGHSCDITQFGDEKELTQTILQTIAYKLAPKSHVQVCRLLGVYDNAIEIVQANYQHVEEQAYQMLRKWTEIMGKSATIKTLKIALEKAGRSDVVQFLY